MNCDKCVIPHESMSTKWKPSWKGLCTAEAEANADAMSRVASWVTLGFSVPVVSCKWGSFSRLL